jgi:hypothetical protein
MIRNLNGRGLRVSIADWTPDSHDRRALPRRHSGSVVLISTSGTRLDEGPLIDTDKRPEKGPFTVNARWVGTADLGRQRVKVQLAANPPVLRRMGEVRESTALKGGRRPSLVDNLLAVGALIVAELRVSTRRAHRLDLPRSSRRVQALLQIGESRGLDG